MSSHVVIGVDVGGTFTDILALDEHSDEVRVFKIPSTREDQSIGFLEGILEVSENVKEVGTIVHGTTVATNALLERKGAKTGIITTAGFRDVLEMRRRDRPTTWGLWGQFTPVVQRIDRLEVEERTLADGTVRVAVDLMEVERAAKTLLKSGCEAVCLFFINGYANPENERKAAEILRKIWPNEHVSVATEILPEIREFERCSTTTLNAYLQPPVANYLARIEDRIKEKNKTIDLHLLGPLQSNKVKKVFGIFDYIHSLDRNSLAEKISDEVQRKGFCPKIFIQVNTGLEQQKAGIEPENLYEFIKTIRKFMSLNIVGLMCIPPINEIPEKHFKFLKKLADENGLPELSMGMSSDYKAAIKNGATYIRVGTAIFGSRQ